MDDAVNTDTEIQTNKQLKYANDELLRLYFCIKHCAMRRIQNFTIRYETRTECDM